MIADDPTTHSSIKHEADARDFGRVVFGTAENKSRSHVIDCLYALYRECADHPVDTVLRPRITAEEFFLFMSTVAAYISEENLCRATYLHDADLITDDVFEDRIRRFVDAHTFIYEGDSRWVKAGSWKFEADTPLYYVSAANRKGIAATCNAIQAWLFITFEKMRDSRITLKSTPS
jgi:hypothetical protein